MNKNKILISAFFLWSFFLFAEGEVRELPVEGATTTSNVLDKGITAQNEQTLEVKELDTQELLLQNQDLESSSIKITGKALKEQQQQVKVVQNDTLKIEEELAAGVKPKSFWQKIKDFFTGE
ncbi:hypothetical protein FSBG_01251 [Fusobacterium gonidiaformans 3-1-5R]|uniref:Uncharacterized protein n=2 Tax=Fusobacterium TaxID=848 RepID=E5BGY1_9FUSO|nr:MULTISPECIES: hypothetical protein [Fusobacterium]AVQ16845.1 hypothetical protein C4N16_04565 [Fusobacterium gonidiaformans ATCC 25563]EFS21754.1 hypothetical protein FSBG_01251 [Fusobacterium gonidiaformans 3-1-5R]EFS28428.1 hypothetical protein FGAG_00749 [Fusobacterium gonidiaformans ATCC 25563]KXA13135.1 hypothetical protein HMPREF3206_01593 [Fusobacterium equinum]